MFYLRLGLVNRLTGTVGMFVVSHSQLKHHFNLYIFEVQDEIIFLIPVIVSNFLFLFLLAPGVQEQHPDQS